MFRQITNAATFVTMFYARFDQSKKTLQYANGGHNPPLLVRPKTGESLLLDAGGPILGILPQAQFSNTLVTLDQGDILTLFTDGVIEQENEAGDEFSIDRLEEVVRSKETEPAVSAGHPDLRGRLRFAGGKPQADDLTVVVVKVL